MVFPFVCVHGVAQATKRDSKRVSNNKSDEELIGRAAEGDKEAFADIVRRYQSRIFKLAYRFTGNSEQARELAQDIFLKVYKAAGTYVVKARFQTWLYRIATNHCLNAVRKSRREHSADNETLSALYHRDDSRSDITPREAAERTERVQMVQNALANIPERQRMAIVLLRYENMSYREIARTMQCSVAAIESLVFRGMQNLKSQLSKLIN